ncbi:hypothetical protein Tco_0003189 [Tanacetum coccineum]
MDSIIPIGQKNTLASRMELYMQNRDNGRLILESVEHGPLIWPTIEENRVTRIKKYDELSATEKIQADCDLKATNIILQVNQQTYLAEFPIDSGLAVPMFKQGDDPIDAINKMMSFLSTEQELILWEHEGIIQIRQKILFVEAQGNGKVLNEEELEFLADPGIAEAKAVLMANLSSYGPDVLSKVPISDNTNNDMLNQSVQEMQYSKPSHFVEHPENEIHSYSNIIPYSQYLIESQNAAVQDTNSSAQQDALILSVFEQLSNQVTNYNKVNNDNLSANESLSAELERYKERVKLLEERQNVDLAQQITSMLYDGNIIAKENNVISIADSEETLMLEEESRSKMLLKQSDPIVLEKKERMSAKGEKIVGKSPVFIGQTGGAST